MSLSTAGASNFERITADLANGTKHLRSASSRTDDLSTTTGQSVRAMKGARSSLRVCDVRGTVPPTCCREGRGE